jgi:hypothetical protein
MDAAGKLVSARQALGFVWPEITRLACAEALPAEPAQATLL